MLLSNHLVLFEFELALCYEKLVVLIFQLLIKLIYLSALLLKGSKDILALNDRSTWPRPVIGYMFVSFAIDRSGFIFIILLGLICYFGPDQRNSSCLISGHETPLLVPDELGDLCLIFVNYGSI